MRYLLIFIFTLNLFGVTNSQIENLKLAYDVGKTIQARDGMTFEVALSTVMMSETSGGTALIGDKYEDVYYIIHDYVEIKIKPTSNKFVLFKNYNKKVRIHKGKLKPIEECSLGKFQVKLSTAKAMIKKYDFLKGYRKYLKDDAKLVNILLLFDTKSAKIAGAYLLDRYNLAKKKKLSDPYYRAISAYNGGWNNERYVSKFKENRTLILFLKDKHNW